jgi:RimJ/RimL family protein N-acetyltransferase
MTTAPTVGERKYPRNVRLDSSTSVTLRLMGPSDRDAVLALARSLPPHDLLFLRTDITQPDVVDEWIANIKAGRTATVLAEAGGQLAGYALVHLNDALWTRHVGEIRMIVHPDYRRSGLGRQLAAEIFALAKSLGLGKLTAQMTPDQRGARATFERLGFHVEAVLSDHVIDREGGTHDLVVMSHDVTGFSGTEDVA